MRREDRHASWGKKDSRRLRNACPGCDLVVGVGVGHAGGCPIRYPDSPPGIFYLASQACELIGVSRMALSPASQRFKAKVPRDDDPPFVEFDGKIWIGKEALGKWLAVHRPRWLFKLESVMSGEAACPHCGKTGSRTAHGPGCPGRISLAKLHELKKKEGHCGSCGRGPEEMKQPWNFGYRTCRLCRTSDKKRTAKRVLLTKTNRESPQLRRMNGHASRVR